MHHTKHTVPCPYCGQDIPRNAHKCGFCREWIVSEEERYSNHLSLGKLFVLCLMTQGLYFFYWFYRNWNHLGSLAKRPSRATVRTIGLFIPILDMAIAGMQFWQIRSHARERGIKSFAFTPILLIFIALRAVMWAAFIYIFVSPEMQEILYVRAAPYESYESLSETIAIALIPALILLPVQRTLNAFWLVEQPKKPQRPGYSHGETSLLVIGGFIWLLLLLGPFIPVDSGSLQNFFNENVS
ncbi:hypothetical protein HYV71_04710 [Candidatus Uhrbacteria bacterium]|nr:hypothetical protein [Candidatus Uhrbacteria bacterium]